MFHCIFKNAETNKTEIEGAEVGAPALKSKTAETDTVKKTTWDSFVFPTVPK